MRNIIFRLSFTIVYVLVQVNCYSQFAEVGYINKTHPDIPLFIKNKSLKEYFPRRSSFKLDTLLSNNNKGPVVYDSCRFSGNCFFNGDKFPDFSFQNCSFENLNIMFSTIRFINLTNSKLNGLDIINDSINLLVIQKNLFLKKPINISTCCLNQVVISDCGSGSIISFFDNKFLGGLSIYRDDFSSKIAFNNCSFSFPFTIRDIALPDTFDFENNDLSEYRGEIDLTGIVPNSNRKCKINLYGTDINKLRLDMTNFELCFPAYANIYDSIYIYGQLLNEMKRNGFEANEGYKRIDIANKEIAATTFSSKCLNLFQKYWWNYGYNKSFVVIWSGIFLILFYIINLLIFNKLMWTYPVDNFMKFYLDGRTGQNSKKKIQIAINCFMLTCVIFWGLRIKIDKFKLDNYWICAYIMLQYIIGIICLAYIANIIISR